MTQQINVTRGLTPQVLIDGQVVEISAGSGELEIIAEAKLSDDLPSRIIEPKENFRFMQGFNEVECSIEKSSGEMEIIVADKDGRAVVTLPVTVAPELARWIFERLS